MRLFLVATALVLGLLGGCSIISPSGPAAPQRTLASEQQRLARLFRGTPVVFEMQPAGSLHVTVPLEFSFDANRAVVKPPLAAVLDRIATSQRAETTRFRVAAPADRTRLALERAASTRDYLVSRGIAPTRFSAVAAAPGDLVSVQVLP